MNSTRHARRGNSGAGCLVFLVILAVIFLGLLVSNPSETDLRQKAAQDGWVPVGFERTNLGVMSIVKVNGFTGEKKTYIGIAGTIF